MRRSIQKGFMKIMPLSLVAFLAVGLFLFSAVTHKTVQPTFAADTVSSAEYIDVDGNGTIDFLKWTFDENLTACTFEAGDWSIDNAGSIGISSINNFVTNVEGAGNGVCDGTDPILFLGITVSTSQTTGGATAPVISYTNQGTAGSLQGAGVITDKASVTQADSADPLLLVAAYEDSNGDGTVDNVNLQFSEAIDDSSISSSDFSVTINTATTGEGSAEMAETLNSGTANDNEIDIAFTNGIAGSTIQDYEISLAGSTLDDGDGNYLAALTNLDLTDLAPPVFLNVQPQTNDYHNGQRVDYDVTENLSGGTVVWTRTGGTADANSPHTCVLQGSALTAGTHNDLTMATDANACVSWANPLVDGTVYTIEWYGGDGSPASPGPTTTSTGVTYDITAPTPNVTAGTAPIYEGDLVQEVTVLYDESMDNSTTPTIVFGSSTNFTSNSDGAWSTTTNTNDTWTETFTHDGTGENILPDSVNVSGSSAATDLAGNSDNQDSTPDSFGIDTIDPVPTITSSPSPTNGTQTISFTTADTGGTGVNTVTCSVDGSTFSACTTGDAYSTLGGWGSVSDGSITLTLRVTDNAGNTADDTASVTKDTTPPVLQSFSSGEGDATYGPTDTINITATYNENIAAGSTMSVVLDNGATVVLDTISTTTISGTYTVGATGSGQDSSDLTVASISAEGIADALGNTRTDSTVPSSPNNIADGEAIVVDTTAPSISSLFAVQQDGSAASATANLWYYYSGDSIRFRVTVDEALSSLKACVRSITGDDSGLTCSTEFATGTLNTDFIAGTNVSGLTYEFNTALSALAGGGTVTNPSAYPLNLLITDTAGNSAYPSEASETFIAALNVDPKDLYTGTPSIDNAGTTDWSTILDFTDADVTFTANDGTNDVGSIAFTGLNLTDSGTIEELLELDTYLVVDGDQGTGAADVSIDSDNLTIFDTGASISIRVPSAVRPGIVVRDNAGTLLGSVPNDEAGTPTVGTDTLGSFSWDGGAQTISFTTTGFSSFGADSTAPTVDTYSPADDATAVSISSNLVLTFAENVGEGTGNIVIYKASDDSIVETIDITGALVTFDGTTGLTINPTDNLAYSTAYYVQIDATAIEDSVGNPYAGIADKTTWSFTTAAAPVVVTPTTTTPSGGGGGGGGGGGSSYSTSTSSSNTTTTSATARVRTITGSSKYSSPIRFYSSDITVDTDANTAIVDVTGEGGSLLLRPNKLSTIFAKFSADTSVTADADWDGSIQPPLIKSLSKISRDGELIKGGKETLKRAQVKVLVEVGGNVALQFNKDVTLEIPVDLDDGTVVAIYTQRPDSDEWEYHGEGTVQDGKLLIETDHFTLYAIVPTGEQAQMKAGASFTDTLGHWAHSYIEQIAKMGIVSGKSEGIFAPNDKITRAELTKIATKAFGIEVQPTVSSSPFGDVSTGAWFAPYVVAARNAGIVQGVSAGSFAPNQAITRAAALKIILGAAGLGETTATSKFPDVASDAWYAGYVSFASQNGIVSGYANGSFGPANSITRAEVAKIVIKVKELLEQE